MKIILEYPEPALLLHGGMQVQIGQTKAALEGLGCEVDYLRWWDAEQKGDILHWFGRAPPHHIHFAHQRGIKVVVAALLGSTCSRPRWQLWFQRQAIRLMRRLLPAQLTASFRWDTYQLADAAIALTPWETHLLSYLFDAPGKKVHLIPNGVDTPFFESKPVARGPWLVCTAIITERKRVLELAQAAIIAKTPLWVIGKPYSDADPYGQKFIALAKAHRDLLRYEGPIQDRKRLALAYREARGFVLLSTWESLSLSALEAAACECPLLLSDLPWARTAFREQVSYCHVTPSAKRIAPSLRAFYDAAPNLKAPARPLTWTEVGQQLKAVYQQLLS